MSDAPSTTTPAPVTTAPDYRESFPNSPTMFDAPAARPADPAEITYREAFPSMAAQKPLAPPVDAAEELKHKAAFPSMYDAPGTPDAPTTASEAAPAAEDRTVTFKDVGDVTVPSTLHLDPGDLSALAQAARDLRLDAPAAQRLLDMHAQGQANLSSAADAAWSETVESWRAAVQSDAELGGARFDATVAEARATIARFGTPELKEALNSSGLGSHPEMVRLVIRLGRALAEAEEQVADATQRFGRALYGRAR